MKRTLLAILLCAATVAAQTNRGGISGTVMDSSGAIVLEATVIITNLGTNETKRLTTSEAGTYTATSLDPVTYRIEVEAAGFKKAVVEQVKVDTATTATVNDFLNIPADGLVYLNSINLVGAANALSSNSHVPYMQSWSVSLAYELTPNTVVETSYNGSKGTHLFLAPNNLNQVPFDLSQSFVASGLDPVRPPENDPLGRQSPTGALVTFGPVYLGTKYLGFQGLNEAFNSSADSLYHAATVSLRRRYAKGLTSTVNYTYGKSMDDASDAGDVRFVNLNVRSPGQVNYGAPRSMNTTSSSRISGQIRLGKL